MIERHILDRLSTAGAEYEVIACNPELADTAAFCEHYGYPLERSANTIVVAARKDPNAACACVVLATTRLDVNHKVCELLGVKRASFAGADQTRKLTGMMIGGVTPFALPESLTLFVDARVTEQSWVIVGGGSRSMKLRVSPDVLVRVAGGRVVEGLTLARDT
jgi:prolyl-tRNA editing enzyme YbaK/EbsC (Cys-tRNA(Pro) deacylase)